MLDLELLPLGPLEGLDAADFVSIPVPEYGHCLNEDDWPEPGEGVDVLLAELEYPPAPPDEAGTYGSGASEGMAWGFAGTEPSIHS